MKKPEVGQKIRIIGDTFEQDPHQLDIGSVYNIDAVNPATKKEDLGPMEELLLSMLGEEPFDIPARVRVQFGPDVMEYANVPFEDFEIVEQDAELKVRMLQDDGLGGFKKGEVFKARYEEYVEEYVFTDKDGDERFVSDHEHEVL